MLAAHILGLLPTVPAGERVGGVFENVPTCGKRRLTGCVMGWATYDEAPPEDTRFCVPSGGAWSRRSAGRWTPAIR